MRVLTQPSLRLSSTSTHFWTQNNFLEQEFLAKQSPRLCACNLEILRPACSPLFNKPPLDGIVSILAEVFYWEEGGQKKKEEGHFGKSRGFLACFEPSASHFD